MTIVLKILGIALLVLLLLLLLLLLLVLFVPVRYRARGSYSAQLTLTLRVSFLFSLLAFGIDMLPGKNNVFFRFLGFKKILTKADNTGEFEDTIEETLDLCAADAAKETKRAAHKFEEASVEKEKEKKNERTGEEQETGKKTRLSSLFSKIKEKLTAVRTAAIRFFSVAERVRALFAKESNRRALSFLGNRLLSLLKKLLPKRFSLTAAYSTGSPDTTGELLGVISLFPSAYRQRWQITPDFTSDSFYVDAQFDVRGRIFAYQMVGLALSVLLDKNCRTLYNEIKNGS